VTKVSVRDFEKNSELLLKEIKKASDRAFCLPKIEPFMKKIKCSSLKARSADKRDITIVVHDLNTGMKPVLGFSIKSKLGGASTLLNPGRTTNFIYCVTGTGLSSDDIKKINSIFTSGDHPDIKTRIKAIEDLGGRLSFTGIENKNFYLNLKLIDSFLPDIVASMLLRYYTGKGKLVSDLIKYATSINICDYDTSSKHPFYEYKIKNFLTDIALGMTPAKVWKGNYDATGGYIIVKEDGEVMCYHIYNRNEFQEYLIKNTRLETPSTTRYNFGYLYETDRQVCLKLNLQIRFI
jgi:type II restriction enzyme